MIANVRCAGARWGDGGGGRACAGGTQSDRPSSTRGHSTWEPDPSRVVWQRLCERLLAEKTICCHADIQRIYSMKNGGKKCGCVKGGGQWRRGDGWAMVTS